MDKKSLAITLGAAVVVGGLGLTMYDSKQGSRELTSALILPELAANASSIDRIKIESSGNQVVVESHKADGQWLIDNLGNYTADVEPLSKLINNLKDARKVEAKTAKPERFHHLGLRDITDGESKAVLVTLSGGGKEYKLLIGDNAKQGSGQYVRLADDNQTWLVDKGFNKPDTAEDWVNTKLFDFELKDIQSVALGGKFDYQLTKENKEQQNFTLSPMPEQHKLKYDSIVDSVPRAVSNLRFESLQASSGFTPGEESQLLSVKLFDKDQQVELNLSKVGDKHYVQLNGANPLWQAWVYQISEFNFNQLVKDKMDYLDEDKPQAVESTAEAKPTDTP